MHDQIQDEAISAARQLLCSYRASHPDWLDDQTPIDDLVSWLDIDVATFHPDDLPAGTFGYLEEGESLIWLNRALSKTLRRFTLAHELGHAVLHRPAHQQTPALRLALASANQTTGYETIAYAQATALAVENDVANQLCQEPDVQEEATGLSESAFERMEDMLGIGMTYDPHSERELAANMFAAELLMPIERVQTLYLSDQVPPTLLAETFNVSHAAMLNRLAGLTSDFANGATHYSLDFANMRVGADLSRPGVGWGKQTGEDDQPVPLPREPAKHYDEFQQAAIAASTPALIVAGPGSGKTSTLIGRVQYLIEEQEVAPAHILALTFSRKAALEMEERLQLVLQHRESSTSAIRSMPTVSTFHAFCAELLRLHGALVGLRPNFALVDETEGYFILLEQANAMRLHHYRNLAFPTQHFPAFLRAISRAKDELVTPKDYRALAVRMTQQALETQDEALEEQAQQALEVAEVYSLYEAGLRKRQDTDFGGLIMLAVQLLQEHPAVLHEQQQKFQHILVDEFQDMNRASGILLRLLAGEERRIWVVGDANQAIYGFRGASPANISRFEQDYPGAIVLPLSRNYRSLPDIVHLAESFRFRQLMLGEELEADAETGTALNQPVRLTHPETYVTLAVAEDNASELAGLIADLHLTHEQGFSYKDIVVLCRTRAQARTITSALLQAGLPVIEHTSLMEDEHIRDLLSVVLLIADRSGMGILRAARMTDHLLSQQDIESLLLAARRQKRQVGALIVHDEAPEDMSASGRHALSHLSAILRSLVQIAPDVWSLLAQYLFIETTIMRDLLLQGDAVRIEQYDQFLRIARMYDQHQQKARMRREQELRGSSDQATVTLPMAVEKPPIREQAKGFLEYVNGMLALGQDGTKQQESGEQDAEQPEVIRVMTVHASKGLEFPVVYLPNLRQGSFPTRKKSNPVPLPDGMLPPESESSEEGNEACLFYVGVTRARDRLVLSYSERNGKQKAKPSQFLEALLAGLPDDRITKRRWHGAGATNTLVLQTGNAVEEDEDMPALIDSAAFQPDADFIAAMQPETLSVSALENYQRCPRRYMYSTICGFSSEEGSYQVFWQATQQTLATLKEYISPPDGKQPRIPTQEETQEIYSQHWQRLGGQEQPFATMYEQHGYEVVELMREKLISSGETNWELRSTMQVDVAGRSISLSIDRVEQPKQGAKSATFVRSRFGKRKEKPKAGLREFFYVQASRQLDGQPLDLLFHNLSTGETMPITLSPRSEQGLLKKIEESLEALERNEFPARPDSFTCPSCPFFFICPA
jgi:DNA helicase-2/ATP-dependent DNA helicase PcrA